MRRKHLNISDRAFLDELYRNSYRVVMARTAAKLGDYRRAEELLSQVYLALVPQLEAIKRLDLKSQVAYTVATAGRLCDDLLERREQLKARRFSYRGFELSDLEYIDGLDEDDKKIFTERLDLFRSTLSLLSHDEMLSLKQYVIEAETARREGISEPIMNSAASSALGMLSALLGKETPP